MAMAGEQPLANPRWERYCQERLAGRSQRQAMLAEVYRFFGHPMER